MSQHPPVFPAPAGKLTRMQIADTTHDHEFGPSDAARRGSTTPFEQDATHLLLHQLAEIGRTFDTCGDQIWGFGFNPMKIPMLFVFKSVDLSARFGICSGPVDYERLSTIDGAVFGEIVESRPLARRRHDLAHTDLRFHWVNDSIADLFQPALNQEVRFDAELARIESLVFDFSGDNYRPQSWEFARFVVHEAFHQHQLFDAKWRVPVGYDPATPPCSDSLNGQLAREEARLLELAALSRSDHQAQNFVHRFLEMRAERHRRWPDTEMLERGTEQVEGSARYVENLYSRFNGRADRLNMPPEALRHERDWVDFGRLYRTGARMLEILDRFEISWRKRLIQGEDPYGILCQTLN